MTSDRTEPAAVVEREVWTSAEEFVRCLSLAAPRGIAAMDGQRFCVRGDEVDFVVELEARGERTLGKLTVPVLRVRYRFPPGRDAACRRLLAAIDRAMQRGGG
jgi:hypothetical protein